MQAVMTRHFPTLFILTILLSFLAGCTQLRPVPDKDYAIWDRSRDRWITESELVSDLRKTDYVLIGDLHQSQLLQERLLAVLQQLKKDRWLEAIVLDALQSKLSVEELTYPKPLDKVSSKPLGHYGPLIEWVEQEQVPLVAAGMTRDKLQSMKKPEARQWLEEKTRGVLPEQEREKLRQILSSSHPKPEGVSEEKLRESSDYLLAAQQLQDYFMARMLLALKQNSVLITRAFHARNDMGVTPYLYAQNPDSKIKSILMISSMQSRDSLLQMVARSNGEYDYIWIKTSETGLLLAPQNDSVGEAGQK